MFFRVSWWRQLLRQTPRPPGGHSPNYPPPPVPREAPHMNGLTPHATSTGGLFVPDGIDYAAVETPLFRSIYEIRRRMRMLALQQSEVCMVDQLFIFILWEASVILFFSTVIAIFRSNVSKDGQIFWNIWSKNVSKYLPILMFVDILDRWGGRGGRKTGGFGALGGTGLGLPRRSDYRHDTGRTDTDHRCKLLRQNPRRRSKMFSVYGVPSVETQ